MFFHFKYFKISQSILNKISLLTLLFSTTSKLIFRQSKFQFMVNEKEYHGYLIWLMNILQFRKNAKRYFQALSQYYQLLNQYSSRMSFIMEKNERIFFSYLMSLVSLTKDTFLDNYFVWRYEYLKQRDWWL